MSHTKKNANNRQKTSPIVIPSPTSAPSTVQILNQDVLSNAFDELGLTVLLIQNKSLFSVLALIICLVTNKGVSYSHLVDPALYHAANNSGVPHEVKGIKGKTKSKETIAKKDKMKAKGVGKNLKSKGKDRIEQSPVAITARQQISSSSSDRKLDRVPFEEKYKDFDASGVLVDEDPTDEEWEATARLGRSLIPAPTFPLSSPRRYTFVKIKNLS